MYICLQIFILWEHSNSFLLNILQYTPMWLTIVTLLCHRSQDLTNYDPLTSNLLLGFGCCRQTYFPSAFQSRTLHCDFGKEFHSTAFLCFPANYNFAKKHVLETFSFTNSKTGLICKNLKSLLQNLQNLRDKNSEWLRLLIFIFVSKLYVKPSVGIFNKEQFNATIFLFCDRLQQHCWLFYSKWWNVKKRKPNVDALILNTLVSSMWKRGSFGELFVGNDGLNTDLKPKVLKILRMTYIWKCLLSNISDFLETGSLIFCGQG